MSQLSVNFKPLWETVQKVIETHAQDSGSNLWDIWYSTFKDVNCRAASVSTESAKIDFANYRNQLLANLTQSPKLCKLVEKNNAIFCHEFLEVFQKSETQTKKADGLMAFLKVFGKFTNLQSMTAFEQVKMVAQNGLGHFQGKIREASIAFFHAAYKDLRAHKVKFDLI